MVRRSRRTVSGYATDTRTRRSRPRNWSLRRNLVGDYLRDFWDDRPLYLGGDPHIPDTYEEVTNEFTWHLLTASFVHVAHRYGYHSGMGALSFANNALGQIFFKPPVYIEYPTHIYQQGSSPTFVRGMAGKYGKGALRTSVAILGSASMLAEPLMLADYTHSVMSNPQFYQTGGGPIVASNPGVPMALWIWLFG